MAAIVAAFRGEIQQSMYLGILRFGARKPAPLLGASEKCASKVSKSGKTYLGKTDAHKVAAVFADNTMPCRPDQHISTKEATMLIATENLSRSEKLQIIEQLWDELSRDPADVQSPAWHADALREA